MAIVCLFKPHKWTARGKKKRRKFDGSIWQMFVVPGITTTLVYMSPLPITMLQPSITPWFRGEKLFVPHYSYKTWTPFIFLATPFFFEKRREYYNSRRDICSSSFALGWNLSCCCSWTSKEFNSLLYVRETIIQFLPNLNKNVSISQVLYVTDFSIDKFGKKSNNWTCRSLT